MNPLDTLINEVITGLTSIRDNDLMVIAVGIISIFLLYTAGGMIINLLKSATNETSGPIFGDSEENEEFNEEFNDEFREEQESYK